ncbi:MAG: PIN domain-containing protein [Candidatus Hydrogenedentes bacterium]|nr:PIN domain-containing protein [Candidatus Hydrogenedentota bacterium]
MIAVDTNILVYAHRRDSPWYPKAVAVVTQLCEGTGVWAIPWPCIHEFLGVVTNARYFGDPTAVAAAMDQVCAWMASPSLALIGEKSGYWDVLGKILEASQVRGPKVHDARIAAICRLHGVSELWSADRDFSRFPDVKLRNPLIG